MVEKKYGKSHELSPIILCFGDVITTYGDIIYYVITDLYNDNSFSVRPIMQTDGKESLGLSGTGTRDNINEIVGNWDLDRIQEAIKNYNQDTKPKGRNYDLIRKAAKKGPKTFT